MADPLVTIVTTTVYGSWLPGDARGYVQNGELLPANPILERHSRTLLKQPPDLFSRREQTHLFLACAEACKEFGYRLFDLSIEAWHLHWIVQHDDAVKVMVGRLKNRMRQRLNRGRIWTEGYCHHVLRTDEELLTARKYIRRHPGCRVSDRVIVQPPARPGDFEP